MPSLVSKAVVQSISESASPTLRGNDWNELLPSQTLNSCPIFLIPGFGAPTIDNTVHCSLDADTTIPSDLWYTYWGEATKLGTKNSPVFCTWPSGLASLHDRAAEVFAQIKGGIVDYGEEHSAKYGHARYGRMYQGLFPQWSAENPIHVVAHSLGGTTARVLQHLLHIKAFAGHDTSADWIVSMTVINAPLNGALQAYALGERETSPPDVVPLSPGWFLGRLVHVVSFLGLRPLRYDLGLDQWRLSWRDASIAGGAKVLINAILGRSALVDDKDNAAYDCTIHSMADWNAQMGPAHPQTYYVSFVGNSREANTLPEFPHKLTSPMVWFLWCVAFLSVIVRRMLLSLIEYMTRRRTFADLRPYPEFNLAHWRGETKLQRDFFCKHFAMLRSLQSPSTCCTPLYGAVGAREVDGYYDGQKSGQIEGVLRRKDLQRIDSAEASDADTLSADGMSREASMLSLNLFEEDAPCTACLSPILCYDKVRAAKGRSTPGILHRAGGSPKAMR